MARKAPKFFTEADAAGLQHMMSMTTARARHPILEVGSWAGDSARWLLDRDEDARAVCVDTWLGNHEINQSHPEWADDLFDQFLNHLLTYAHRCVPIRLDSVSGIYLVAGYLPQLRFVYLDAGHTEEQVCADIRALRRHWPGSPILGDDWERPDVQRGVLSVFKAEHVASNGNKWWVVP